MSNWFNLENFVRESNLIEGINRDPLPREVSAHQLLLGLPEIKVADLVAFVAAIEPGAELRQHVGMNVFVGEHVPPGGGPLIPDLLKSILDHMNVDGAYQTHRSYESLHPFMDGNGRSGRALWLYQMGGTTRITFLRHWYYQSLEASR